MAASFGCDARAADHSGGDQISGHSGPITIITRITDARNYRIAAGAAAEYTVNPVTGETKFRWKKGAE